MPLVSCQHEAMAAPTCARAGSQLGTDHAPLDFSVYRARGREGINRGQSSNTLNQQQLYRLYFLLEHNYSLVTMSCILHIIWVNSCTRNKIISAKTILREGYAL